MLLGSFRVLFRHRVQYPSGVSINRESALQEPFVCCQTYNFHLGHHMGYGGLTSRTRPRGHTSLTRSTHCRYGSLPRKQQLHGKSGCWSHNESSHQVDASPFGPFPPCPQFHHLPQLYRHPVQWQVVDCVLIPLDAPRGYTYTTLSSADNLKCPLNPTTARTS